MTTTSANTERAVVLGGGIAGLCTALALASRGLEVQVLERDPPPPEGDAEQAFHAWPRRGAAQFRHPHAFLGLMCNLLQDNYPDLLDAFYAAGARRLDFQEMLSAELEDRYRPAPGDERLWVLLCRRATIETVLRRYVSALPNVTITTGIHIDGLVTEPGGARPRARGFAVRRDCTERFGERIDGDLLIDASGRMTKGPRWLDAQGLEVREESDDAEIVYYTRHYRLNPGFVEPPRGGKDRSAGDLGYIKFGVFPGDNGNFAIIVCLHRIETQLRDTIKTSAGFDAVCRAIPGLAPWLKPEAITPTTEAFGIGDIRAVWRHYAPDDEPLLDNYFAVGDASLRTNPLYGRGCSTGILHAHILADVIAEHRDPRERALRFAQRTETELRPIFSASLKEDRSGIARAVAMAEGRELEQARGFKARFALAFGDALAAAARYNLHVFRGISRTINLLEAPGAFLKERKSRWIVLAYMLRGRRRNAAARLMRGPSRQEMLAIATAAVPAAAASAVAPAPVPQQSPRDTVAELA
ncbi:MAG: FAD-dependent oxidoreductase [Pseudomonadota bacterium]